MYLGQQKAGQCQLSTIYWQQVPAQDAWTRTAHLSCWAGHVDASILLLRASDVKDLYVQDYDVHHCRSSRRIN
ncbi:hypothetical protein GQ600_20535 [Phytophthora cactorum]|nr:hypothetical protein GQ600_20535 [Phytophthora cactorum]